MELKDFLKKYEGEVAIGDDRSTFPLQSRYPNPGYGKVAEENLRKLLDLEKKLEIAQNPKAKERLQDEINKLKFKAEELGPARFPMGTPGRGGTKEMQARMKRMDISDELEEAAEPDIVPKEKPEKPYDGPFGELGEYFSKNADKRDELFDYISSIGRQLVKPTNPGEARSFLGDISAGLEAGESKIAAKDAASLDALVKRADAAESLNPLQQYTSKMKEVRQEAIMLGYEPGTKAYNDYVGTRLRGEGVSEEINNIVETIENLRLQAQMNPDSAESIQKNIDNLQNKLTALTTGKMSSGSGVKTYKYNPEQGSKTKGLAPEYIVGNYYGGRRTVH